MKKPQIGTEVDTDSLCICVHPWLSVVINDTALQSSILRCRFLARPI